MVVVNAPSDDPPAGDPPVEGAPAENPPPVGAPAAPAPDDKDWTWVLEAACPDCGYAASAVRADDLAGAIAQATLPWSAVLARPDAGVRPSPAVWSPLEYGCHVRDVCRLFDTRTRLILDEDDPVFTNWDQDATAVEDRYWAQDPTVVAAELATASATLAATYAAVPPDAWERPGRRSDGSAFTTASLGRYLLHDLVHHLADVDA
ncbi:MAG: DinB family protein [Tetrasphaera sp.]|jgi:hypothetical protein|nr:DinB family protein [Tetrasphaera sp.]